MTEISKNGHVCTSCWRSSGSICTAMLRVLVKDTNSQFHHILFLGASELWHSEHLGQRGKIFLAHSKLCQIFTWIKRVERKSILLPVWICWIWGYVRMKQKHKFVNVYNFIRLWVNLSILNLNKRHFGLKSRHSYADAMISYTFKVLYVIEHWLDFFILQSWLIMAWISKTYIVTVDLYTYKTFLRPRIRPLS